MCEEIAEVMLVEDNCDHAELIGTCLRGRCGVERMVWLRDGKDALSTLRGAPLPRLVLLDLCLPLLGGHELLTQVKGDRGLRATPMVVLTTSSDQRDIRRAYELGANGYLVKPESFDELGAMLSDLAAFWLRRNRSPDWVS